MSSIDLTEQTVTILRMPRLRFELTFAFGVAGSLEGVLISGKGYGDRVWKKAPATVFTNEGETLGDLLKRLAEWREQVRT